MIALVNLLLATTKARHMTAKRWCIGAAIVGGNAGFCSKENAPALSGAFHQDHTATIAGEAMNISEDLILRNPRFARLPVGVQMAYIKTYALTDKDRGCFTWKDEEMATALQIKLPQWKAAKEALVEAGFFTVYSNGVRVNDWKSMPTVHDFTMAESAERIKAEEARVRTAGMSIKEKFPWVTQWRGRFAREYDDAMLRKVMKYLESTPAFAPGTGLKPTKANAKGWLAKGVSLFPEGAPEHVQERYQQCLNLWDDLQDEEMALHQVQYPGDDTEEAGKQHVALTLASPEDREALLAERRAVAESFRKKLKGEEQ